MKYVTCIRLADKAESHIRVNLYTTKKHDTKRKISMLTDCTFSPYCTIPIVSIKLIHSLYSNGAQLRGSFTKTLGNYSAPIIIWAEAVEPVNSPPSLAVICSFARSS